jgi:hypothetical protein
VYFPENKIKCQHCIFCRADGNLSRFWCALNNTQIYNPFIDGLPDICPIKLTGEIVGTRKE